MKLSQSELPSPSLLDRVQNRPDVEGIIHVLRKQRTKDWDNAVYIPPQAKFALQASDNARFPLMEKMKEFLEGDQEAGKSTFSRELEIDLWRSYKSKTGRIPLHISLPGINKPEHDIIAKQLRKAEFTETQICEMKHYRKLILFCDGYDESPISHKFITHLEFEATPPRLPWKALLGFHNLKSLKIIHLTLSQENIDRFWQLCSQLEQLDIRDLKDRGSLSSWTFPHLKELRLWTCPSADIPLTLEFMRRCPALTSFDWCGKNVGSFTTEFIQLLDARTWPLLHSFNSRNHTITSNDVLKIAQGMQQIVSFGFIVDRLQPKPFLEVLRPHFSRLKKLTMDTVARMPDGFIPEILSSCPMLEIMEAPVVDAKEIVEGEPWVCLNLRELRLGFRFTPATLSLLQPLVFDQLCKLTRLESLALGTRYIISLFQERVDLRLEQGLGKLSKLVSLRVLNFSGSKQAMNKRDVDWILEHWTELTDVFGIPRYNDPVIASELGGRIRERGVTWHAIY
ncbi:hypothetical protein BGX31_000208 [Mortierella sp. GBA43]|nr:hypothetical protein BGX31_000208 [Mortierella sp. GBA43]